MQVYAGTSGFSYKEWKGYFYPEKLKNADMLRFYGERLPAVELNNTFYRMPRPALLESWLEQVPPEFRFSVKASRRITHIKRLKNAAEETAYLLDKLEVLGERLGAILFQLPPSLRKDVERLRQFLELLPEGTPAAFEFRHESWRDDAVHDALRAGNFSLCLADTDEEPEPSPVATADWGYFRLRRADYSAEALRDWASRIAAQPWRSAYVFFKHEDEGAGPAMASRFLELTRLERR